jgi:hypothetical protein
VQHVAVVKSHRAFPQQPGLMTDAMQACRLGMQAPQVCTLQVSGLQQLAADGQLLPSAPQHIPPAQAPEQQSAPSAQVAPLLPQVDR